MTTNNVIPVFFGENEAKALQFATDNFARVDAVEYVYTDGENAVDMEAGRDSFKAKRRGWTVFLYKTMLKSGGEVRTLPSRDKKEEGSSDSEESERRLNSEIYGEQTLKVNAPSPLQILESQPFLKSAPRNKGKTPPAMPTISPEEDLQVVEMEHKFDTEIQQELEREFPDLPPVDEGLSDGDVTSIAKRFAPGK